MENNNPNYSNSSEQSNNYGQQQQQYQNQGNYQFPHQGEKLPADNIAMILAIISTVLFMLCCCFGGYYFAFVLSTIGFVIAHKSIKKYEGNPNNFSQKTYKSVYNAKVFNLVMAIVSFITIILSFTPLFQSTLTMGDKEWNNYYENNTWNSEETEASKTEEERKYDDDNEPDTLETKTDSALPIEEVITEETSQK
ncbi:hypothetical protein F0365_03200 [Nonlabens sp. Ci31]|uniref:hypothetical protein n=1 Tax=Nonlabens sp. Ci31 TaxID=2608253 RepID=UPI001462C79A|nr:hypothetical protein [Nonlabens sp. Ci31]QJP33484.1 hypothetical protein F0365_03200 [Nonlabens sp. Ci31]